jgi:hypothetical protein
MRFLLRKGLFLPHARQKELGAAPQGPNVCIVLLVVSVFQKRPSDFTSCIGVKLREQLQVQSDIRVRVRGPSRKIAYTVDGSKVSSKLGHPRKNKACAVEI